MALRQPTELRALFDDRVRATVGDRLPSGWRADADGQVLRVSTSGRGLIFTAGLIELSASELMVVARRAREFFAAHGQPVEWKTFSHDNPNLVHVLRQLGFQPEPAETVMIARSADLAVPVSLADGISIRSVVERAELERIASFESAIWNEDWSWLADDLEARISDSPAGVSVLIAEAEDTLISAAWLVPLPGTGFGGLWGGSTLESWRGRGIYRAMVAARAQLAVEASVDHLWVDASIASRPILTRLGMTPIARTTPWVWSPGS